MKIKELYSDKSKWTQGAYARNEQGDFCPVDSPEAICWCLDGALRKCYPPGEGISNWVIAHEKLISKQSNIIYFNDNNSFETVKALVEELDV